LQQQEITVAVTDGHCAAQTLLPTIALATRRALATTLPDQARRDLNTLAATRATAVHHAHSI
jgi:hypothetical protein